MKRLLSASLISLAISLGTNAQTVGDRPNILLVPLDDAGFMDFGAYGSDTATPTIDALAQSGAMFTRYFTTPLCGPSRVSLMTGQANHVVGAGALAEVLTDEMRALPAYRWTWVVIISGRLVLQMLPPYIQALLV